MDNGGGDPGDPRNSSDPGDPRGDPGDPYRGDIVSRTVLKLTYKQRRKQKKKSAKNQILMHQSHLESK